MGRASRPKGSNIVVAPSLQERAQKGSPALRCQPEDLLLILRDGEYKNQHETGTTSSGFLGSKRRREIEQVLWPDRDGPIYAYLREGLTNEVGNLSSEVHAASYGPVRINLQRNVLQRSTMTVGDSLGFVEEFTPENANIPFPATNPDEEAAREAVRRNPRRDNGTLEVQVFGGVTLDDIESVDFDRRWVEHFLALEDKPLEDFTRTLDEVNIPWSIAGSTSRGMMEEDGTL